MIKALFFDIDGTLVSFSRHRIPDSAISAIRMAKQAGKLIFISTGRPPQLIDNLHEIEDLIDGYVSTNGANCYTNGGETLLLRYISEQDVRKMFRFAKERGFAAMFVGLNNIFTANRDEKLDTVLGNLLNLPELYNCDDIEQIVKDKITQISPIVSPEEEPEIMSQLDSCSSCRWIPLFMDVVPKGTDKARGIEAVIRHYGITSDECMSFGDGGNDIAMLEYAGIGVAMGNASEEVRNAADYVTTSVDDDGIYNAMRHFGVI